MAKTTTQPHPAHVPEGLVHPFEVDFRGPMADVFARLDALRDHGRVLWLERGMGPGAPGAWFFTQAADIQEALRHPDLFSSQMGGGDGGTPVMIPIFMDPPEHTQYRRLLNPLFSPGVVVHMEEGVRGRLTGILDHVAPQGSCDFVADVAIQFPTRVFTSWMGLPEERTDDFVHLVGALIHGGSEEERGAAMAGAFTVLNELIEQRLAAPADDLMSRIIRLEIEGRPLSQDELFRIAFLLFLAGLDTVAAALSFSFWHLARTPADRASLASGAVPAAHAVEELLRQHAFVNLPRIVARDAEFAGVELREGDPVILSLPMATRDPDAYSDATDVQLDRPAVRQAAFGLGPHRCLGSHLARLEMRLALEEWHARIPEYRIDGEVGAYSGTVMGVTSLPLRWD